ncbi:MAG: D-alanyl-D-alanine carboxypeptidase family protein [Akkermansiaceae bacterium]
MNFPTLPPTFSLISFPAFIRTLMTVVLFCLCVQSIQSVRADESYLVMEAHSGRVLLAADSERKRPVASLTKVATAKVVLDWAKVSQTNLATLMPVPQGALVLGSPNPMNVKVGDQISLRNALYSALLGSDNIAAYTLAEYVGASILKQRQQQGMPQKIFVQEMNQLALALGMKRTRFANSHGLDLPKQSGYSTAADMARLSVYAMRDIGFAFFVKQVSREIEVIGIDGKTRAYTVSNTNTLLGVQGINGIKTGLTLAAGECIAINAHRSPLVKKLSDSQSQIRNRDLVVVVLGSADRMLRAQQLVAQAWPLYDAWAEGGFLLSPDADELIVIPQL